MIEFLLWFMMLIEVQRYEQPVKPPRKTIEIQKVVEKRETKIKSINISVIHDSSVKSYMSYKTITDTTSPQWKLIHEQEIVRVDERGFLRDEQGRYGVAVGSGIGGIGDKIDFTLSSGKILKTIVVDQKADHHTCENNFIHLQDSSVIEFVVDTNARYMQDNIQDNGYVFSGNFNNSEEFKGKIKKIEKMID